MINTTLISITSQGQITIPAKMRKALGLLSGSKAIARIKNDGLYIEKSEDLLSMAGSLNSQAKFKNKTADEVIEAEKDAIADAVAERYMQKEKRSTKSLYIT